MKAYAVGAAVRDHLLGLDAKEKGYVVVGAAPALMRALGFESIGLHFPAFIHPETGERFALARAFRTTRPNPNPSPIPTPKLVSKPIGRKPLPRPGLGDRNDVHRNSRTSGPSVTLEQDLWRRDVTINAMAIDLDTSVNEPGKPPEIIDPFGGRKDLEHGILRHVSGAFADDPMRILRIARLASRYAGSGPAGSDSGSGFGSGSGAGAGFTVAPETMALMTSMVAAGEIDATNFPGNFPGGLPEGEFPERVWKELSRGLMEDTPSRMFSVLRECGALERILPEVDGLQGPAFQRTMKALDLVASKRFITTSTSTSTSTSVSTSVSTLELIPAPLFVRLSVLLHGIGPASTEGISAVQGHAPRNFAESSGVKISEIAKRLRIPGVIYDNAVYVAREHENIHGAMELDATELHELLDRCAAARFPGRFAEILVACECIHGIPGVPYPQGDRLLKALEISSSVDSGAVAKELLAAGKVGSEIGAGVREARLEAIRGGFRDPGNVSAPGKGGSRP